jgi:hypothetical protein
MEKELKFNINLNKRTIYSFVAIGIFVLISVTVFAYGTSTPGTFGHSAGELDFSSGINGDAVFNGDVLIEGGMKIGSSGLTCGATNEGYLKYNSVNKMVEYCDGTSWGGFTINLVNGIHTGIDCTSAGGVVYDTGNRDYVCRMNVDYNNCPMVRKAYSPGFPLGWTYITNPDNGDSTSASGDSCLPESDWCPTGWTNYQDWTRTTEYDTKVDGVGGIYCSGENSYSGGCEWSDCQTGEHSFSDTSRESCDAFRQSTQSCGGPTITDTCYAYVTEAGCY